ncbi:MATE family efflux transporter [Sulfitobacter sp. MF3-043]|uniref:MATE family efflux transporter n=1 Tax=Sulfitobacter sediminivivens TaxID=3252902 RepID=UPI003EC147D0
MRRSFCGYLNAVIRHWWPPSGLPLQSSFYSVSIAVGFMIAATAMISRSIGRWAVTLARRQAGAATVIAAGVQTCVALLVIMERHDLVALAGAEGETARLAARYLAITMPSLILMAVAPTCSGALRAEGFGAQAMYVTLFSGVLLMVLDPILIVWLGLGLDGAAIGLFCISHLYCSACDLFCGASQ